MYDENWCQSNIAYPGGPEEICLGMFEWRALPSFLEFKLMHRNDLTMLGHRKKSEKVCREIFKMQF